MNGTYGIQLRHPLPYDLVGTRLTLAAIGTAYEASYGWRLVQGDTSWTTVSSRRDRWV